MPLPFRRQIEGMGKTGRQGCDDGENLCDWDEGEIGPHAEPRAVEQSSNMGIMTAQMSESDRTTVRTICNISSYGTPTFLI